MSLQTVLGTCMAHLQASPLCEHADVLETKIFSETQFFFKIRAILTGGYQLQARIYVNHDHIDYAYQLFTEFPVLRWDNKEEFPHLSTYPHHHHNETGHVTDSPLTGMPEQDMVVVLQAVSRYLLKKTITSV